VCARGEGVDGSGSEVCPETMGCVCNFYVPGPVPDTGIHSTKKLAKQGVCTMGWVGVYWGETIDLAMTTNTLVWIVNGAKYCYLEHKIRTTAVTGMDESVERDNHLINPFPNDAGNFTTKTILRSYPQSSFMRSIKSLDWFARSKWRISTDRHPDGYVFDSTNIREKNHTKKIKNRDETCGNKNLNKIPRSEQRGKKSISKTEEMANTK